MHPSPKQPRPTIAGIDLDLSVNPNLARQVSALLLYAILGNFVMGFSRIPYAFTLAVGSAVATELLLSTFLEKRVRLPLGPMVAGISLYLLLECTSPWIYFCAGAVSQLAKRFKIDGRQVFNPSNFGLLAVFYCLPLGVGTSSPVPGQWNGSLFFLFALTAIGLTVCYLAGRSLVAAAYVTGFVVISYARAMATGLSFLFFAGTALGVPQVLFAFHMVTDPKTSPEVRWQQLLFGVLIGLFDASFRWLNIINAPFVALLFVCALWPLIRAGFLERPSSLATSAA